MGIDEHAFVADMNDACRTCGRSVGNGNHPIRMTGHGLEFPAITVELATPKNWDERWMAMARLAASFSKDRSTKVGSVIVRDNRVLSIGWNGFCRGHDDENDARHERPAKYKWTEHAERNAIYNAARDGISLFGSQLYCRYFPCTDCARGIIQSGLGAIYFHEVVPTFAEDCQLAELMLFESGVRVVRL